MTMGKKEWNKLLKKLKPFIVDNRDGTSKLSFVLSFALTSKEVELIWKQLVNVKAKNAKRKWWKFWEQF